MQDYKQDDSDYENDCWDPELYVSQNGLNRLGSTHLPGHYVSLSLIRAIISCLASAETDPYEEIFFQLVNRVAKERPQKEVTTISNRVGMGVVQERPELVRPPVYCRRRSANPIWIISIPISIAKKANRVNGRRSPGSSLPPVPLACHTLTTKNESQLTSTTVNSCVNRFEYFLNRSIPEEAKVRLARRQVQGVRLCIPKPQKNVPANTARNTAPPT